MKQLLADHIVAVEQLEVLLLLAREESRAWTAEQVSEEMRTSVTSAGGRLEDLTRRGFLVRAKDGYHYQPAKESMRDAVAALAVAYAEKRYTIIELIFSKPIDNLRVYANAFRFRKDDPDG